MFSHVYPDCHDNPDNENEWGLSEFIGSYLSYLKANWSHPITLPAWVHVVTPQFDSSMPPSRPHWVKQSGCMCSYCTAHPCPPQQTVTHVKQNECMTGMFFDAVQNFTGICWILVVNLSKCITAELNHLNHNQKNNDSSIRTPCQTCWCRFFCIPHRTQDGIATITHIWMHTIVAVNAVHGFARSSPWSTRASAPTLVPFP